MSNPLVPTHKDYENMFEGLRSGGSLDGPRRHSQTPADAVPNILLTDLKVGSRQPINDDYVMISRYGAVSMQAVVKLLEIPSLPKTKLFAYYTESSWVVDLLKKFAVDDRKVLQALERAALLEELYIF